MESSISAAKMDWVLPEMPMAAEQVKSRGRGNQVCLVSDVQAKLESKHTCWLRWHAAARPGRLLQGSTCLRSVFPSPCPT